MDAASFKLMQMKKILLFDIDGTLLLTGGCGKIALERVFLDFFEIENAWGNLIPDGKTDPNIIDEIAQNRLGRTLSAKEHAKICKLYLKYFDQEIKKTIHFRLMPGVSRLLEILAQRNNVLLGIATGNLEPAGWQKLKRGKIHNFFGFGGFGSDSRERSEIIQIAISRAEKLLGQKSLRENIFVIGDTHYDVRAAHQLGLKAIAVTTGSYAADHFLNGDRPTHLLSDLTDSGAFLNLIN